MSKEELKKDIVSDLSDIVSDTVSEEEIKLGKEKLAEKLEQERIKAEESKAAEIPDIEYLKCFCWVGFNIEAKKQGNTSAKIGCFKCREIIADTTRFYTDKCQEIGFGMVFCKTCYTMDEPAFQPWVNEKDLEDEYEDDDS